MLDDHVRAVLQRLEREDADERERGLPAAERSRAVARTTGQFLFGYVAPQWDCEVLEVGGSRGYSSLWPPAGARPLGGAPAPAPEAPGEAAPPPAHPPAGGPPGWGVPLRRSTGATPPAA